MSYAICPLCRLSSALLDAATGACITCRDALSRCSPAAGVFGRDFQVAVVGLYPYDGRIRTLLHSAKVRNDHAAVRSAAALIATHPVARALAFDADVIVPCSSSAWSRARGRIDVAWHLADSLCRVMNRPAVDSPWHLRWRWRKRARMSHADRHHPGGLDATGRFGGSLRTRAEARSIQEFERRLASFGDVRRLLIVDDVATTGATVTEAASALAIPGRQVMALTLARVRPNDSSRARPTLVRASHAAAADADV